MSVVGRAELLHAVADEINRRFDDFLAAELADTGKPRSLASHIDIPRGAANFKVFADIVKNVPTESFQMTTPDGGTARSDGGVDLGLAGLVHQPHHLVGGRVAVFEGLGGGDEFAVDEVVELFHGT